MTFVAWVNTTFGYNYSFVRLNPDVSTHRFTRAVVWMESVGEQNSDFIFPQKSCHSQSILTRTSVWALPQSQISGNPTT